VSIHQEHNIIGVETTSCNYFE